MNINTMANILKKFFPDYAYEGIQGYDDEPQIAFSGDPVDDDNRLYYRLKDLGVDFIINDDAEYNEFVVRYNQESIAGLGKFLLDIAVDVKLAQ